MPKQALQKHWMNVAAEANPAIDFNDRNAGIKALAELLVGIDVDD